MLSASRSLRSAISRCGWKIPSSRSSRVALRSFSSDPVNTVPEFQAIPPSEITAEMAHGVQAATGLYLRYGAGKQRLEFIRDDKALDTVIRWQRMMETYLGTQVHVIAGLGYTPDEYGLGLFGAQLAQFMQSCAPDQRETFRIEGRDQWRDMLAAAFGLDLAELKNELSIVDARNMMHKVSSRMQEPAVLELVKERCAAVGPESSQDLLYAKKHQILQDIIVNTVYLDGNPSLVEECGFGSGEKGYAMMQCVMAEHEADPLVVQYASAAMSRIWEAAGLDANAMQQSPLLKMQAAVPDK